MLFPKENVSSSGGTSYPVEYSAEPTVQTYVRKWDEFNHTYRGLHKFFQGGASEHKFFLPWVIYMGCYKNRFCAA